jgi:hypothetical protein
MLRRLALIWRGVLKSQACTHVLHHPRHIPGTTRIVLLALDANVAPAEPPVPQSLTLAEAWPLPPGAVVTIDGSAQGFGLQDHTADM